MISSRERGWPWQSCNRAGAGCGGSCQAGQAGSSLAGRMASQAAFPYGSKLRRPQGFHNPGNGPSKKSRGWGGRVSKTFHGPPPGPARQPPRAQSCPGRRTSYGPRTRGAPHTCSSPGQEPQPQGSFPSPPSAPTHQPLPRLSPLSPETPPPCHSLFILPTAWKLLAPTDLGESHCLSLCPTFKPPCFCICSSLRLSS